MSAKFVPLVVLVLVHLTAVAASGWSGRQCCRYALVPACRSACGRATSVAKLRNFCRKSDEAELYRCIKERKRSKSSANRGERFEKDADPEAERCCLAADTALCRAACVLVPPPPPGRRSAADLQPTMLNNCARDAGFWQCYDSHSSSSAVAAQHRLELSCCHLATSERCSRLCRETYSHGWHHQGPRFERQCLDREYGEPLLRRCVRDAEVPCQPNSGRLQFCGDFIDGSTGLYRRWDEHADSLAKTQYINWYRRGTLDVPFRNTRVLTTERCRTALRRLACFVHLEPCRRHDHTVARICRSDCVRLSEQCLSPAGGVTDIETFCSVISSPEHRCERLPAAGPPQHQRDLPVSSPCLPSPCEPGHVCRVGRPNQSPYVCLPGCRLSSVSGRMVAVGATVLLPPIGEKNKLSLLMCQPGGNLVECRRFNIPQDLPCNLYGKQIARGAEVRHGCRVCVCADGALLCRTAPECVKSAGAAAAAPGPACDATPGNGRCHSETPLEDRPCEPQPCTRGYRCQPRPELCVDSVRPCAQHTCAPESETSIGGAAIDCKHSSMFAISPENTWTRPLMACRDDFTACRHHPAATNCSLAAPLCSRSLKLYFSGRRLAALGARLPVRAVLAALRPLVATADCALTAQLTAARQLTITLAPTADGGGGGGGVVRACRLEADKLRAWLANGSPAAASEPALWPVVYAELLEPPRPAAAAGPVAAAAGALLTVVATAAAVRIL